MYGGTIHFSCLIAWNQPLPIKTVDYFFPRDCAKVVVKRSHSTLSMRERSHMTAASFLVYVYRSTDDYIRVYESSAKCTIFE